MTALTDILREQAHPLTGAAARARHRYGCLGHFGEDPQAYGYAASFDLSASCEDAVVNQLVELQRRAAEYVARGGCVAVDEYFYREAPPRSPSGRTTRTSVMPGPRRWANGAS